MSETKKCKESVSEVRCEENVSEMGKCPDNVSEIEKCGENVTEKEKWQENVSEARKNGENVRCGNVGRKEEAVLPFDAAGVASTSISQKFSGSLLLCTTSVK